VARNRRRSGEEQLPEVLVNYKEIYLASEAEKRYNDRVKQN